MLRWSRRALTAAGVGPFDPYKILGVKPNASKDEIKKAYHGLALRFHPDSGAEGNSERFAAVNEAYEAVKDGTWSQRAAQQQQQRQREEAERGGGGWDAKARMYVYEQPGSTTEGYVSGDTERNLRLFMIGCFLFIFVRVALFYFRPARRQPAGEGTTDAGQGGSGSVHAGDEVEYRWDGTGLGGTPTKDPLSHR
ncbi:DnaJ domain containing protein [Novymonas esmeraldas]|uniref:DnaJ domain containing protein n=1 Tax=Novymonas esmeraldas TaxID=1808958 RepID=A0AAW0EWT6_9TRYP